MGCVAWLGSYRGDASSRLMVRLGRWGDMWMLCPQASMAKRDRATKEGLVALAVDQTDKGATAVVIEVQSTHHHHL
jgi:hypothetical protein